MRNTMVTTPTAHWLCYISFCRKPIWCGYVSCDTWLNAADVLLLAAVEGASRQCTLHALY